MAHQTYKTKYSLAMTTRIRPRNLYYITLLNTFVLVTYLISTRFPLFSSNDLAKRGSLKIDATPPMAYLYPGDQTVFTDTKVSPTLEQNIIRINLAQTYENARLDLLTPEDEVEAREEEVHEDYIGRLSSFTLSHFEGSKAQEYLIAMLVNLNDHISPPLLNGAMRKGMIKIVGGNGQERRRKRVLVPRAVDWEMNVFDKQGMDRGLWALSKGSEKLEGMWRSVKSSEDRKVLLKYLALLLWGGAYADDDQLIKSLHLPSIARTASSGLDRLISGVRTELQPLAPPPPPLPDFMPPSLEPNWATATEPDALKEISLILHRKSGATWVDRFPLSSDMILVKAFHPVFLDIVERTHTQIGRINTDRAKGINTALDDVRLFHDAVDRYLHVQYGTSLEDLMFRDEDLRIGDVLLLRSHA